MWMNYEYVSSSSVLSRGVWGRGFVEGLGGGRGPKVSCCCLNRPRVRAPSWSQNVAGSLCCVLVRPFPQDGTVLPTALPITTGVMFRRWAKTSAPLEAIRPAATGEAPCNGWLLCCGPCWSPHGPENARWGGRRLHAGDHLASDTQAGRSSLTSFCRLGSVSALYCCQGSAQPCQL